VSYVTVGQILDAHAQFGQLDLEMVKRAMGPNFPESWNIIPNGQGIFKAASLHTPADRQSEAS
jgi:hypothetical protein